MGPSSSFSAYTSTTKPSPLKISPKPNLRGIDGSALRLDSAAHTSATSGANSKIASGVTDWNQPTGKIQPPGICRSTQFSARKLSEVPNWK